VRPDFAPPRPKSGVHVLNGVHRETTIRAHSLHPKI
jgi:hypothetical protein